MAARMQRDFRRGLLYSCYGTVRRLLRKDRGRGAEVRTRPQIASVPPGAITFTSTPAGAKWLGSCAIGGQVP